MFGDSSIEWGPHSEIYTNKTDQKCQILKFKLLALIKSAIFSDHRRHSSEISKIRGQYANQTKKQI